MYLDKLEEDLVPQRFSASWQITKHGEFQCTWMDVTKEGFLQIDFEEIALEDNLSAIVEHALAAVAKQKGPAIQSLAKALRAFAAVHVMHVNAFHAVAALRRAAQSAKLPENRHGAAVVFEAAYTACAAQVDALRKIFDEKLNAAKRAYAAYTKRLQKHINENKVLQDFKTVKHHLEDALMLRRACQQALNGIVEHVPKKESNRIETEIENLDTSIAKLRRELRQVRKLHREVFLNHGA